LTLPDPASINVAKQMNVCFWAPAGDLNNTLLGCARSALGRPITDLSEIPGNRWKDELQRADLTLVDVTAANAIASYIIGLADGLSQRVVLLSAIQESLPSIFEDRAVIVHRWNLDLLRSEFAKLADAPNPSEPATPQDDSPAGQFHKQFGDLLRTHGYVHRGTVDFDGSTFTLREQEMDLPLVQDIARRAKSLNLRVRLL
jgi:hypothetical protein